MFSFFISNLIVYFDHSSFVVALLCRGGAGKRAVSQALLRVRIIMSQLGPLRIASVLWLHVQVHVHVHVHKACAVEVLVTLMPSSTPRCRAAAAVPALL